MRGFKNNTQIIRNIVIVLMISALFYSNFLEKKNHKERIASSFRGVVFKKEHIRGDNIYCYDINKKKEEYYIYASAELFDQTEIGDTIYKLPNSNYCFLINKEKKIKLLCYFENEE